MADQPGPAVAPDKELVPGIKPSSPQAASTPAEDPEPQVAAEAAPAAAASGGLEAEEPTPVIIDAGNPKPQETAETAETVPASVASAETKYQAAAPTTTVTEDQKPQEHLEDVPDPDEDDLDDLDDMLEEFSAAKLAPKVPAPAAPIPSIPKPAAPAAAEDGFSEEEFAKQLQAGMADLLGEMETSPEMKAQFEQFETMFKELGATDTAAGPQASGTAGGAPSQGAKGAGGPSSSFQDNIRRTMERMQASGESATAAATADSQAADDLLAEMLKSMNSGQGGGLGEGSEEDFSKMLLGMMEQLTNKEILYEPMKELNDKYPEWLEKNKETVSAEDMARYKEQQRLAAEIVAKFEEKTYADSNAADREYIVDRMQKMQAEGSPPSDLVGDMPSAQEALGGPDEEACNPQ